MKRHKKQNIKKFYQKRIWTSVALLFLFIGFFVTMVLSFVYAFGAYLLNAKITAVSEEAEHLGGLIAAYMEEGSLLEVVSSLERYLGEENDICVTDKEYTILLQFGEIPPDFGRAQQADFVDSYTIIPDMSSGVAVEEEIALISLREVWRQSLSALPKGGDDRDWLNETIYSACCWVEIPVAQASEYHLYYRASVEVDQKNIFFGFSVVALEVALLLVPVILLFTNVLSSIITQRHVIHLLYLDTVTDGRNWMYFVQRSRKILCKYTNAATTYAIASLHMDHYQDYCACYGAKAGEELLKKINGFLQVKVGRGELFGRFANADFGLLLRCGTLEQCEKRLRKMLAELTGIKDDRTLGYHIGLCLIEPEAGRRDNEVRRRRQIDIEQVYHYANVARESAHEKTQQYIAVFDDRILQEQLWRHKVEETMELALINKEFQIYLQPKYNPVSGKIVGAEALVRWLSPTDGLIEPERFIPIFEANGFITQMDDYMISSVAKLQSEWKIQGRKALPVSVNVSRANFTKENLAEHICHLVDGYGADHSGIELEVTESAFFGNKELLQNTVKQLKMYGFRIAMDDFGAGYSSLNSLKDLPIDVLKLDMEFFQGKDEQKRGEIVVREAIQLAKKLNMKVVAEGIEHKEQVDFLAEQECDMIQGFYYAKPMPVEEFDERIGKE